MHKHEHRQLIDYYKTCLIVSLTFIAVLLAILIVAKEAKASGFDVNCVAKCYDVQEYKDFDYKADAREFSTKVKGIIAAIEDNKWRVYYKVSECACSPDDWK